MTNPPLDLDREGMLDHTPLKFGKYKGHKPVDLVDLGKPGVSWLKWAYENVGNFNVCSAALYKDIGGKGKRAVKEVKKPTMTAKEYAAKQAGKMAAANDMDDDIPF